MKGKTSYRSRSRKAFRVANRILLSYIGLVLLSKILGKSYYQKRISLRHEKNAKRVKTLILELEGLFTKVGQMLSMMSSVLPDQYMEILESLQDKAPASPFIETKKLLEEDLGEPIENVFNNFEDTPIASASIGQVYRAKLKSGEDVAVKVQHYNIEELAAADLKIIEVLIKRVSRLFKINGMEHVYHQVREMITDELDYEKEARSMEQIRSNLQEDEQVIVPMVFSAYCSKRILVASFHDGVKITDINKIDEWKIDRHELGERLILLYCKMILEQGFYHADPHPGNLLVNKEGKIILLDFGAVAILSEEMRLEIPALIQAIIRKDHPQILASLQKMGFVGSGKEAENVAKKLIEALNHFLQNEVKIQNLNFRDISLDDIKGSSLDSLRKEISIRELTKTIQVPKDWVLLERTILLVSGTTKAISPELNQIEVVKPYMQKLVLKEGGLRKIIIDALKQQITALLGLPSELSSFLKKANQGDLEMEIRDSGTVKLYALGHQFIFTLLLIASTVFYYLSQEKWWIVVSICAGILLVRSIWLNRK